MVGWENMILKPVWHIGVLNFDWEGTDSDLCTASCPTDGLELVTPESNLVVVLCGYNEMVLSPPQKNNNNILIELLGERSHVLFEEHSS